MKYKLGEICEIVSGSTPKTNIDEYWDGTLKWITPAEITDDSYIIEDSVRKITELGVKKTGLTSFPTGTVILSSRAPIGKVAIAGCEMYCNQGFKNLICSDKINNRYLYWFLKGNTRYLNSLGRGATFKEISKGIVSEIVINVPDIISQEKAANNLERISQIIKLRKRELEVLDVLIKARFVELFGNIREEQLLEDISEFVTVGIANSATHAYVESGIPMLRNQNIKENYLDDTDLIYIKPEFAAKYESKKLKENDIIAMRTGYPGIACLVPKKYEGCQTFTTLIVRLKAENNPSYVCSYINSDLGKRFIESGKVGVAQQNFGAKSLAKMPIKIAPKELQDEYADFVKQVDKSKVAIQKSLEKMQLLFDSLMQKYFC